MAIKKLNLALTFLKTQPACAVAILEEEPVKFVLSLLKSLSFSDAAVVVGQMLPYYVARLIQFSEHAFWANILSNIDVSTITRILHNLTQADQKKILQLLPEKKAFFCGMMLSYAKNEVGAWITSNCITLPDDCNVNEARKRLIDTDHLIEIGSIYILNRQCILQGKVNMIRLLNASGDMPIMSIISKNINAIPARMPLVSAIKNNAFAHSDVVPVVNKNKEFIGLLRHVDLRNGLQSIMQGANLKSNHDLITNIYIAYTNSIMALISTAKNYLSEGK